MFIRSLLHVVHYLDCPTACLQNLTVEAALAQRTEKASEVRRQVARGFTDQSQGVFLRLGDAVAESTRYQIARDAPLMLPKECRKTVESSRCDFVAAAILVDAFGKLLDAGQVGFGDRP